MGCMKSYTSTLASNMYFIYFSANTHTKVRSMKGSMVIRCDGATTQSTDKVVQGGLEGAPTNWKRGHF